MTKTTDLTPVLNDFPELAGIPATATIILSIDGQRDYEITLEQLQSLSGWNGTGTPGGGTGDVEFTDLASTDGVGGAGLIALDTTLSADLGGAANTKEGFEYFRDNALLQADADDPPQAETMSSAAGFIIYYPETGAYAWVSKDAVDLEQGTSQGNPVLVTATTYSIGEADTRVTGDSASNQTFTIPASATTPRPIERPLRVIRAGAGTITVQAAAGVTINGALGGSVSVGDRFAAMAFDQVSIDRWVCAAVAASTPTDVVAPTAVTFFPADGATNVPVDVNPYVEFSEPIAAGIGLAVIRDNDGGFADLFTYDMATDSGTTAGKFQISGNRFTLFPDSPFANGIEHAGRIAGTCIDDLAGNSYAGIANDTTWSWTTVAASVSDVTIVQSGGFSVAAGSTSTSHSEPISGLLENDVLYVAQTCDAAINDIGKVAGFADVVSQVLVTNPSFWIGRKVQTASPDTAIAVPRSSARRRAVVWWVVRGANANIDGTAVDTNGVVTAPDSPSYTQTNADMMPFTVAAVDDQDVTLTAPSGWTLLQAKASDTASETDRSSIAVAYQAASATAGTVHNPGTWGGATGTWRAATFGQH